MQDKIFAEWVALNQIATVRLGLQQGQIPPMGTTNGDLDFANRSWHWRQDVVASQVPGINRIDFKVRPKEVKGGDDDSWYVTVSGLAGNAMATPGSATAMVNWDPDLTGGAQQGSGRQHGDRAQSNDPNDSYTQTPAYQRYQPVSHVRRARSGGFTLLELLVAMFIAAIIFAMGYGTINQAVKNRTGLQEQQKKLLELQTHRAHHGAGFCAAGAAAHPRSGGRNLPAGLVANATSTTGSSSSLQQQQRYAEASSSNGAQPLVALTRGGLDQPNWTAAPCLAARRLLFSGRYAATRVLDSSGSNAVQHSRQA